MRINQGTLFYFFASLTVLSMIGVLVEVAIAVFAHHMDIVPMWQIIPTLMMMVIGMVGMLTILFRNQG